MALTYIETASWATAGTLVSGQGCYKDLTFTGCAVGDLLFVFGGAENYNFSGGTRSVATQSGSTSTWTPASPATTINNDTDAIGAWATVSSAGTVVVRVQLRIGSGGHMGACGVLIPAAEFTGTPGTPVVFAADADGQASVTLPATSTVFYAGADWAAANPGTTSTPAGGTNRTTVVDTGAYSVAVRTWTGQAAGTRAYGPSGLSGDDYSGVVMFVQEASGGTTPVTNTATAAWSTRSQVTATRAAAWSARSVVAATGSAAWSVRSALTASAASAWSVRSSITRAAGTAWSVRALVTSLAPSAWSTRALVTSAAGTAWSTRSTVTSSAPSAWSVRSLVTSTRDAAWSIASVLTTVTRTAQTAWSARAAVTTTRPTAWSTRARVTATAPTAWSAMALASRVAATAWSIRERVTAARATAWDVRVVVDPENTPPLPDVLTLTALTPPLTLAPVTEHLTLTATTGPLTLTPGTPR